MAFKVAEATKRQTQRRRNGLHPRLGDMLATPGDAGIKYTADEVEFMTAMDRYKREHRRPFPAWSEVLDVLRSLGWTKSG